MERASAYSLRALATIVLIISAAAYGDPINPRQTIDQRVGLQRVPIGCRADDGGPRRW